MIQIEIENDKGTYVKEIGIIKTDALQVSSITLSKNDLRIKIGDTDTLTATVSPTNAKDTTINWTSSNESVATVNSTTGEVIAIAGGTATITATANDGSGITANCSVIVPNITYSWDELASIAKIISNTSSITSDTEIATVTLNSETKTLKVGDTTTLDGKLVRILGFNHDTLTNSKAYGSTTVTKKAGISFEYVDFLTSAKMNSSQTNSGGWGSCALRTTLNGDSYYSSLSIKTYIKQVNKQYIGTYNSATLSTSSDYLWLLSCGEIWTNGKSGSNPRGYAYTCEGSQYEYYKLTIGSQKYTIGDLETRKGGRNNWWLRSPYYDNSTHFCFVGSSGWADKREANNIFGIAPGFCI